MATTFVLAFCSITYEFLLSQVLAAVIGGTFLRYTTTIALYITALGIGAFLLDRWPTKDKPLRLCQVEFSLSGLGALTPIIAVAIDSLLRMRLLPDHSEVYYWAISIICYLLVFLVGLLSGIELPLLMRINEEKKAGGGLQALGMDFIGTFAGCLVFPLFFLPYLGVFTTAATVGALNFFVAIYIYLKWLDNKKSFKRKNWVFVVVAFISLVVSLSPNIQSWIVESLYL